jgi:transcriptional regulator with XRE-family HTH domain
VCIYFNEVYLNVSEINKMVSRKIKEKRLELGITQEELGQILGCTQQMIQNYEIAFCAMPIMMLKDMATLCKLPVDWFFIDDNSMLIYFTYL